MAKKFLKNYGFLIFMLTGIVAGCIVGAIFPAVKDAEGNILEPGARVLEPLGTVFINGGLEEGGFDLFSDGGGVYYEAGFNDVKNWYEVGEATLRVSDELEFKDNIDPEKGEQIFYAGSFLVGEDTNYNFTPHNTTIRTENGQIVFMERIYTP